MIAIDIEPSSMSLMAIFASSSAIPTEWPSVLYTILFVMGCLFFLLLNAFFVASEFAIVKVRPSQLDLLAKNYPVRVLRARKIVDELDGYLSANQLGITIASLALGLLAEPYIEGVLKYLLLNRFNEWFGWDLSDFTKAIGVASYVVALAFFTVLHVVVGELIPKAIAIRKPVETTMVIAGPLHWFYVVFRWVINVLNGMANIVLKRAFRIDPVSEGEHVHSAEELALLVAQSEKEQEVTETEREILINALELNDITVKDVMTPRSEVIALDVDEDFEKNLAVATRSKHTRFPLVKGHLDNALGLIHIKDILTLVNAENPDLMRIKRPLKVVPETMALDVLLQFFLKEHAHLAMVVDEHGDPAGLVFMDNVMEELVGDIQDEFDNESSSIKRINEREFIAEGALTLNVLSDHVPELDLESGEISTVGGYITRELGHIPEPEETLIVEGFEAKVTSTDGRRVEQVVFRKLGGREREEREEGAR